MRRFPLIFAAVLLTAACASPSASGPSSSSAPSPSSAPSSSVPPSSAPSVSAPPADPGLPLETPPDMTGKPDKPVEVTVTGQVTAGVEPGCRLLSDGRTSYLLLGGDESMAKVGARVTVTGTIGEGLMTTCQQGTPLQVTSVKAS